jgi:hypothetical protein
MNFTKRVALLLSLLVILTLASRAVSHPEFQFPTAESLKALKKNAEIVAATQIPGDILKRIPTSVLVKTCLDYPLYPDIVFYNSLQRGMDALIARLTDSGN